MNTFDQRWQTLSHRAHGLDEAFPSDLPFGFITQVLVRAQQSPAESLDDILNAIGLRALFVTMGIALVSAGLVFSDWYDFRLERPKLEQTVTSELSWP